MAVWRRYLERLRSPESYQFFTETLLEHRLYEEALLAFEEARKLFGRPGSFAAERAGVLEALGRPEEAREEYLTALVYGSFKMELFDKLMTYEARGFPLKKRLRDLIATSFAPPVQQALLELLLREEEMASIEEITHMAPASSQFSAILFERLRQDLLAPVTPFRQALLLRLIETQQGTTLGMQLAHLALQLSDPDPTHAKVLFAQTRKVLQNEESADARLRLQLLVRAARFCVEEVGDGPQALALLREAIALPGGRELAPEEMFEGFLLRMRLEAAREDFAAAKASLAEAERFLDGVSPQIPAETEPTIGPDGRVQFDLGRFNLPFSFDEEEAKARLRYEQAWLLAHQGELQKSLETLKPLTESMPESLWLDDGLHLALTLTMGSAGSMDDLPAFLRAQRLHLLGSDSAAIALLEELGSRLATASLGLDARGTALLFGERTREPEPLMTDIEAFLKEMPDHWTGPDLMALTWRLLDRSGATSDRVVNHLKSFIDRFPGDLRTRQARLTIARLLKQPR
jgi:tetratricopeptide (TPR) repeat protein